MDSVGSASAGSKESLMISSLGSVGWSMGSLCSASAGVMESMRSSSSKVAEASGDSSDFSLAIKSIKIASHSNPGRLAGG